ncbi:MAG: hypothetical protein BZ138_07945 [Methanosphaera sp. rholeuAM270]|nr:MAG: hypothetical protein BZ138_07945 [Methanosphaera sp. rholeuAM270]
MNGPYGQTESTEFAIGDETAQRKFVSDFAREHGFSDDLYNSDDIDDYSTEELYGGFLIYGNGLQKEFQKEYYDKINESGWNGGI